MSAPLGYTPADRAPTPASIAGLDAEGPGRRRPRTVVKPRSSVRSALGHGVGRPSARCRLARDWPASSGPSSCARWASVRPWHEDASGGPSRTVAFAGRGDGGRRDLLDLAIGDQEVARAGVDRRVPSKMRALLIRMVVDGTCSKGPRRGEGGLLRACQGDIRDATPPSSAGRSAGSWSCRISYSVDQRWPAANAGRA